MPYLGNIPATQFAELKYQDFTGGTGTSFTLNDPVGSAQELEVFVNNVRQEPGVAYTVSGTALTMTGSIASTDDFYVVFQGKSTGTATHPAGQALTATDGTFTSSFTSPGIDDNANANAITIDSSGRVGVGLTTMVNKLALPNSEYLAFQDTGSAESIAIRANSSNAMELLTNGGTSMSIAQGGDVSISDGNLVLASGHGIDFSATGSGDDSTGQTNQSELLTDYEHGLWTPTVNGDSTYHFQYGMYHKIGRKVTAWFRIRINAKNTPQVDFFLDGLPYNNDHNGNNLGSGLVHFFSSIGASNVSITARVDGGGSTINFSGNSSSGTTTSSVNTGWVADGAEIQGFVMYMTDYA